MLKVALLLEREEALSKVLSELGMTKYAPQFRQHRISFNQFYYLDEESLSNMGINDPTEVEKILNRAREERALRKQRRQSQRGSTLTQDTNAKGLTSPAALTGSSGHVPTGSGSGSVRTRAASSDTPPKLKREKTELVSEENIQTRPRRRWEIEPGEVTLTKVLGEGGSGVVHKGQWRGIDVAVKKLKAQRLRSSEIENFIAEIDMMRELRHPNIIQFLGASLKDGQMFFIIEFADRGNLHDCITRENPPWRRRVQFARDIARGMNYLHQNSPQILHRDLKSMNILIDEGYRAKVCDFGISIPVSGTKIKHGAGADVAGTVTWMAPDDVQTAKSDVYSYGLVLWEIVTGEIPFKNYKMGQILVNVHAKGERPHIPSDLDPAYSALMQECWTTDPDKRPTFQVILERLEKILESADGAAS